MAVVQLLQPVLVDLGDSYGEWSMLDHAPKCGQVQILQWAHVNWRDPSSRKYFRDAAIHAERSSDLAFVEWFLTNFSGNEYARVVLEHAALHHQQHMLN